MRAGVDAKYRCNRCPRRRFAAEQEERTVERDEMRRNCSGAAIRIDADDGVHGRCLAAAEHSRPSVRAARPQHRDRRPVGGRDLAHAIRALKGQKGGDLLLIGSATLARSLIELDLIDEFRLMIDPLLVGGGKRLFPEDGTLRAGARRDRGRIDRSDPRDLRSQRPVKRTDTFRHSVCLIPGSG